MSSNVHVFHRNPPSAFVPPLPVVDIPVVNFNTYSLYPHPLVYGVHTRRHRRGPRNQYIVYTPSHSIPNNLVRCDPGTTSHLLHTTASRSHRQTMSPLSPSDSVDAFLAWLAAPTNAPSNGHVTFVSQNSTSDQEYAARLRELSRSPLEDMARPLLGPVPLASEGKTPQPKKTASNAAETKKTSSPMKAQ